MASMIVSSMTRLWDVTEEPFSYWYKIVVDGLFNQDGKSIVHLKEHISFDEQCFINKFKDGVTLEVVAGRCEDPSRYIEKQVIFRFKNCVLAQSKLQGIGSLSPWDIEAMEMLAIIECDAFGRFGTDEFVPFDSQSLMKPCISCGQLYNRQRFEGGCPSCGSPQE